MGARHFWTDSETALLRERYPHEPTAALAAHFGLSLRQIEAKAVRLRLLKSRAYLDSPAANRLRRGDNVGAEYRFKPGFTPWNKGTKGLQLGGVATRFKPGRGRDGRAAAVYQPIGSEVTRDGYLYRKVTDEGPMHRRWKPVHVIVWEAANGAVPAGHVLAFRDGHAAHCVLENLELITRRQLMARNTVHNLPPALVEVIRLRSVLERKINRTERNHG